MDCYDSDPTLLHPISFFLNMLDGADDVTERGIEVYDRCSTLGKLSGLRDFDGWLRDASMSAATRTLKKKQIVDLFRMFGHLDGGLTTIAEQKVVKALWRGGSTDAFLFTLGEMYMMRQVQRLDLATHAAAALGKDASRGFLYLFQVPDVHPRVYDCVVIARQLGDTPDLRRTISDADIVLRLDSKWYLDPRSRMDTDALLDQFSKDLIQSIERDQSFHDLGYSLPETASNLVEPTKNQIRAAFEDETVTFLEEDYGLDAHVIDIHRQALEDRLALGNLVFLSPDSAD
jgi:hypothetical protein